MNRADKSIIWIHDVGQLVRHQHERILALRATNKGLKVGASQELVAIVERRAKELEGTMEKLRAKLESLRSQRKDLEQEAEGPRAVAAYKPSWRFESGLKKMGRISYEFGYRVALERLRGKYPKVEIEQDPFAECPEDANVGMDIN
ncbi:hypothetical protein BHE74_00049918 [Ensete ventricosum]|nr:hypothetical protein BHE74_00049918 [Ensete ventricosum]